MAHDTPIYSLETISHTLEVWGDPDNASYGWTLTHTHTGLVTKDTGGYGSVHTALREALNAAQLLEE